MDTELFNKLCKGSFNYRLLNYMTAVGIEQIEVKFDSVTITTRKVFLRLNDAAGMDQILFTPSTATMSPIENGIIVYVGDKLYGPVYKHHCEFSDAGEVYVNGSFFYNAANKKIWMDTGGASLGEMFNQWSSQNWEGLQEYTPEIYKYDYDFNSQTSSIVSFEFAFLYARDFLKNEFPEDLHNIFLMEAANGDENAIDYIKFLTRELNGKPK